MKVSSIEIRNYRNFQNDYFEPDEELTVITGENGQGKTNLLESIFLLTGSKSFRAGKDIELVLRNEIKSSIVGNIKKEQKNEEIDITIHGMASLKKGRFAKINGVDYGRATTIAGHFTAVVFAPNHLNLVKGSPEGRRRFLDAALCQLYPGYVAILRRFTRALTQKNALIKKIKDTPNWIDLLDIFDEDISETGAEISKRRQEYVSYIGQYAEKFYCDLSADREQLNIQYAPCTQDGDIKKLLLKTREKDIRAGFSTSGPHREDFEITINKENAKIYGSQGQQRSVVLSLKLAEAQRAKEIGGEHPVMLLDDVLSELDEGRQSFLLSKMSGKQNFLTTCDSSIIQKTGGKIVLIKQGKIQ